MLSDAQQEALKLGQKIRTLAMIKSHVHYIIDVDGQKAIMEVLDKEMHKLGYESLTEHEERTREAFYTADLGTLNIKELHKYRKLSND